jgi:hypothetical protein
VARAAEDARHSCYLRWQIVMRLLDDPAWALGLLGGGGGVVQSRRRHSTCWSRPEARSWRELWHSDVAQGPGGGSSPGNCLRKSVCGWQVPSESVAQEGLHCPVVVAIAPVVLRRLRPVGGRLNSASSTDVPFLFPLRWARCGLLYPEGTFIARAVGRPGGPAAAPRPSPRWLQASGAAEARQRTWSLGVTCCRPPGPGRLIVAVSPQSAASPPWGGEVPSRPNYTESHSASLSH